MIMRDSDQGKTILNNGIERLRSMYDTVKNCLLVSYLDVLQIKDVGTGRKWVTL